MLLFIIALCSSGESNLVLRGSHNLIPRVCRYARHPTRKLLAQEDVEYDEEIKYLNSGCIKLERHKLSELLRKAHKEGETKLTDYFKVPLCFSAWLKR